MIIDSIKQSTREKINNNNFDFTFDELSILNIDSTLYLEFFRRICSNEELLDKNFSLALSILENVDADGNNIDFEIYDYVPIFEEKYIYYMLQQKKIYIEIDTLASNDDFFDAFVSTIKSREDSYIIVINGNKKRFAEKIIKQLLDRKEYFVIKKIISNLGQSFRDEQLFQRFLNEFPFNDYNYDINLLSLPRIPSQEKFYNIITNNLDKLDFNNLRDIYFHTTKDDIKEKLINTILNKINKGENVYFLNTYKRKQKSYIEQHDFLNPSLNNYIPKEFRASISLNNLSIVLNYDIELTDEQIDLVCKLIREFDKVLSLNNRFLLDNSKVINTLIETGNYNNLHYYIQDEYEEYFDKIIYEAYKNNNVKILSKTEINIYNEFHHNIIKKFIEEKYFDLFVDDVDIDYPRKNLDELFPLIINYILNTSFDELKNNPMLDKISTFTFKYLKELVDNEQYDKISLLKYLPYENILLDQKDYFVKIIKNNFNYATKMLKECEDTILYIKELRDAYLSYNFEYYNDKILNYLKHAENDSLYDENLYNSVKDYLISKYNINGNHLDSMINKYGYLLIKYIDNDSIIKILNLDNIKFKKFIDLFNVEPYKISDFETIYDSFKQEEFALKYPDIISIFPNIMHSVENNSDITNYLDLLKTVWNDTLKNKILIKYPQEEKFLDNNYIIFVGKNLFNENAITRDKYTNILHIITDYYIAQNREQYRNTYDMYNELSIPFEYDKKDLEKNTLILSLQECLIFNKIGSDLNGAKFYDDIVNELESYGLTKEEANDSILLALQKKFIDRLENNQYSLYYYLKKKAFSEQEADSIVLDYKTRINELNANSDLKKNIGLVYKVASKHLKNFEYGFQTVDGIFLDDIDREFLKKNYYLKESNLNIFELLSNIRIDLVRDNLLDNEEAYESLKRIMQKYKLDSLSSNIDEIISKEIYDLSCSTTDISTFISFFHSIYETEKANQEVQGKDFNKLSISIMKVFKYLDKYAAVSSIYSQILGKEDEGLIRSDPKPNCSTGMTKEERLKKAVEKTLRNFNKNTVKVPTFNHNITLDNGKLITAIVGNFTKPTNITHGERTGACMRIGGVGYSLFDSDDIFHIEFNDSKTDKYISRVTGFRNGNTVFLNELRYSCDKTLYSDLEVVEACKKVAQELLDKSKDSQSPIENVVIHRDYAMKYTKDDRVILNISNNKKGISSFYTDVGNYVHVLATNAKEGFIPVDLDNSKVPSYLPSREKIKCGSNDVIVEQINRLYTISLGLNNKDYYVNPLTTNIIYGYVGEDWYVFINDKKEIISDRIDRDERSIIEYEFAKEEINKYLKNNSSEVKYAI